MGAPEAVLSLWSITTPSSLLGMSCSSIGLVRSSDRPSEMQQPARCSGQHEQSDRVYALGHHSFSRRAFRPLCHCRNSSGNALQRSRENLREKTAQLKPRQPGVPSQILRASDTLLQGPGR
ncbi:hypothetical protein BDP81DRAFT_417043 [Colletotrichum phormii]|uniref:Uncharacterized protein n=1 Tax=Colletotrichum phormii TaxID=359342 RepID=A0AAJ0A2X8_9PEZI|nr:uncharacterized protein BDP81DRAFT_417043 [Colletotrichum phormii]KAK1654983.1 hypothetical protein BDP81DRAFT_417043 [Colletotrichum phormii]